MREMYFSISLICVVVSYIAIHPTPIHAVDKKDIVQIAYQGPLSGPESSLGQSQLEAVKYAVNSFNDFYQEQIKVELQISYLAFLLWWESLFPTSLLD